MSSYQEQAEREAWDAIAASERSSTERAGYRRLEAKYAGTCDSCGRAVGKNETILYNRRHELRLLCLECGARADAGEELEHNGPPRMTTRERLEAKAERRREWAASRSSKADATHARASELAGVIPFGQPVHGARDRNYRERIGATMSRALEHGQMAQHHEQAAAGLERALRTSIYDDDPDAIERLEEKLGRLEEQRAAIKARPHEGWELSNLGATIRTTRRRLEELRERAGEGR